MSKDVQKRLGEVLSIEILQRLSRDGMCVILQSGEEEFVFVPKDYLDLDIVKIAALLLSRGCPEKTIELILSKIEGVADVKG